MPAHRNDLAAWSVLAAVALALTGCATGDSEPGSTPDASSVSPTESAEPTASPEPTESPAPTASPEPTASPAAIPTDCRELVSPSVYEATFGDTPLNDPAFVGTDGAEGSGGDAVPHRDLAGETGLFCVWADPRADITSLSVSIATVDRAAAAEYFDGLPADGYTCVEVHGGQRCHFTKRNERYPVDEGYTHFLRDDVHIYVTQANFPTNDLLGEFVARIWG